MDIYTLPERVSFHGRSYEMNTDFRDILKILQVLESPEFPEVIRWKIASYLFYAPELAEADYEEGLLYLASFLQPGEGASGDGRKRLDWRQDASAIIAGVNAAAGQEIRLLPHVHWWSFLSWFHAMPAGELSTRVSLREKLQKGQKLEPWEQEYYRQNKAVVDLKPDYSAEEKAEMERLNRLLDGAVVIGRESPSQLR